jgi:hypothetical protein
MAVRLSALSTGRTLLPRNIIICSISGTHFCYRLSKPQGLVRPEGLGKFKNLPHGVSNLRSLLHLIKHVCLYISSLQKQCLLLISTETITDKGRMITPLDRASFQQLVQLANKGGFTEKKKNNTIVPHGHQHWICIFASDTHEPACSSHIILHQRRQPTFSRL